jgi:hypothetical protein
LGVLNISSLLANETELMPAVSRRKLLIWSKLRLV